jgi:hypothetical protein
VFQKDQEERRTDFGRQSSQLVYGILHRADVSLQSAQLTMETGEKKDLICGKDDHVKQLKCSDLVAHNNAYASSASLYVRIGLR